jgi:hypothetical protein
MDQNFLINGHQLYLRKISQHFGGKCGVHYLLLPNGKIIVGSGTRWINNQMLIKALKKI